MPTGEGALQSLTDRAPVDQVLAWIDAHVAPLGAEDVPVAAAAGRVLAQDVAAAVDVPTFDRAAADGVALRAEETVGASAYNPLLLRWAREKAALPRGHALRVHAGDPLPDGADAVVRFEQVTDEGGHGCAVTEPVVTGCAVERQGAHLRAGRIAAAAGRRLAAGDVGLLAAAGVTQVPAVRRPRVRCLLAGRGLAGPGAPPAAGAAYDADGPLLGALIERDGGLLLECRAVARELAPIRSALSAGDADVIVVAGGSGPGSDDHAAAALAQAGELAFHGVALRPGETAGLGRTGQGVPVLLLPGTPVDCLWAYEILAGRAIRRLGGRDPGLPYANRTMTAARKIVSLIGMTEACPVRVSGEGTVTPLASFAEAGLAAATAADGFVLVPEESEGYPQGAAVMVYLYERNGSPRASARPVEDSWTTSKPR